MRPNATDLEPQWEVSGGSLEGGQSGVAVWTTPSEPGTYTVSLTLSDGVALFENEISVEVVERDEAEAGG
ncbi:MAG: PKD domain-containing protein [Dehalococcoidia bacterium]|nr:PKD domain-containing protein [Dehalococcoidia bacterium]